MVQRNSILEDHPMRRITLPLALLSCLFLLVSAVWAADTSEYAFISPDALQQRQAAGDSLIIVDICPLEQFDQGHVPDSVGTQAYPVKSEEDTAKLNPVLQQIKASQDDVVVVCPRGKGGAKRTVAYFASKGVASSRLLILEGGMGEWPHETESK